ncbi:HSP70 [Acrasis kona]|uniref:HSP70 n=1 Tax=Acrasis kona TaxID=1008807 RepID=A0AAW2ZRL5_9EUKA
MKIHLSFFIISLFFIAANAAVIGIDLGTDTFKIGIAKSGAPIDLVLNEQSKRKTTTMVGFRGENERYLGENALQQATRFPDMMFRYLQTVLAEPEGAATDRLKSLYIPTKFEKNERGSVDVVFRDGTTKYSVEALFGMIFKYIKELSKDSARSAVTDVVITVPHWFTVEKRQAILDAATIADLKVLSILHENTAAAVQYGLSKHKTLKDSVTTPDYILALLDFGHNHLTASVYNFTYGNVTLGNLELLKAEHIDNLGGVDFDTALAEYFADEFKAKYKKDVREEPRAMARLVQQARRTKEVLSANVETFAQVESLFDDRDFRLLVKREKFTELIDAHLQKVKQVITSALTGFERIDAVELIGGSNRIPAVQAIIREVLQERVPLSFSLNADEAIALGSAFYAATLGSSFRVKKYTVVDHSPTTFEYIKADQTLATTTQIDHKFKVPLVNQDEDFTVNVNDKTRNIVQFDVSNVTKTISSWPTEQGKHRRVELTVGLDRYGLPTLEAQAVLEETITVRVPKPQNKSVPSTPVNSTNTNTTSTNSTDAALDANNNSTNTTTNSTSTEQEPKQDLYTYEKRKKYTKQNLIVKKTVTPSVKSLTFADREEARTRRARIEEFEKLKSNIAGLRNRIESAVYDVRSNLFEEDEYRPYYTHSQKSKLGKFADEVEEWLSNENEDVNQEKYTSFNEKHVELKQLVDPIYERYHETSRREKEVDRCENLFNQTRTMIDQIKKFNTWITEEELDVVVNLSRDTEKFVRDTLVKQGRTALSEPPVALASEFKQKCEGALNAAVQLFKRPKPKVVTPPKNETKVEEEPVKDETEEVPEPEEKAEQETKQEESKNDEL